jgi:hypothetical protein
VGETSATATVWILVGVGVAFIGVASWLKDGVLVAVGSSVSVAAAVKKTVGVLV